MEKRKRTQLVLGLVLILVAAWLIAARANPALAEWIRLPAFDWPMWVVLFGAFLLVLGLLSGAPGMAVPACIFAGVGSLLYYQNATGDWASWAYAWTLVPGFAGIGSILAGILGEDFGSSLKHGLSLILISAVLFAVFGTIFGGWTMFGPYADYAPIVLLFVLGLWLIVRSFLRRN
jgi:hypothetical protein